jgi:RHS repeat-associated protein
LSVLLLGSTARSQVGPVGADHTSVGPGAGHVSPVSPTGGFAAAVELELPPARGGIPVPLSIQYTGTSQAGAAGIGWDIPLSYVRRSASTWHRKPAAASSAVVVPERIILSLGGGRQVMVPSAQSDVWIPLLGDEYTELRRNADDSWTLSTGSGVDYHFESTLPDLWLLAEVRDRVGTDRVELEYTTVEGRAPELAALRYTFDANGTPLYEVALQYRTVRKPIADRNLYTWPVCTDLDDPIPAAAPSADTECRVFGRVDLEGELFRRSRVLGRVAVLARNNLAPSAAPRAIRSYDLGYQPDPDTGAPRLASVDVSGEAGASPITLPVARYRYGSMGGAGASFQLAQVVAIDPDATDAGVTSLAGSSYSHELQDLDTTLGHIEGHLVDTVKSRHMLRDFTGDLIPDLVFKEGETWHLRRGVVTDAGFSLEDGPTTAWTQPTELHMERTLREFNVSDVENRRKMTTTETLVTFEDWNGDSRVDVIDARTGDPNRWDVWLNLPAPDGTIVWSHHEVVISDLVDHITEHGLQLDIYFDTDWTPIERSRSWPRFVDFQCLDQTRDSDGDVWSEDCNPDDPISFTRDDVVDTVGEWKLLDHNGDGYVDIVANTVPVVELECDELHDDPDSCHESYSTPRCEVDEGWSPPPPGETLERRQCRSLYKQWLSVEGNQTVVLLNRAGPIATMPWGGYESTPLGENDFGVSRFSTGGGGSNWEPSFNVTSHPPMSVAGYADPFGLGRLIFDTDYVQFDSDQHEVCTAEAPASTPFTSTQTSGLVDLNGDAVPDLVSRNEGNWTVRFGSSAGFGPPAPIASWVPFAISENQGECGGASSTVAGLVDVDGDGRPEMLRFMSGQLFVGKIMTSDGGDGLSAGRLTEIDNGLGATTRITYANNKTDSMTPHDVPVPEVVVSQTQVVVEDGSAPSGEPVRFAYGTPEMRYDPALNRLAFAGFQRQVTLVGASPRCDGGLECLIDGYAIVVDRSPQAAPGAGFDAIALGGRVARTTRLEGLFPRDPRPVLNLDAYAGFRRAQSVHEYRVTELEVAPWSSGSLGITECVDVDPHSGIAPSLSDLVCHRAAIVRPALSSAWEGSEHPDQGDDNVYVGRFEVEVDERGRPLEITDYGDLRTLADDRCTFLQYAVPEPGTSPVTDVVSGVWVTDCGWGRARGGMGGIAPGEPMFLSGRRFLYDDLPEGRVGRGRVTSSIVETYDMTTGEQLGEHVAETLFYNPLGEVHEAVSSRTLGSSATRISTFVYDSFGASTRSITERASDVSETFTQAIDASTWPSVPHETVGLNGDRTIIERDGLGRAVRTRIVAPGIDHVAASAEYDDLGRRVTSVTYPADQNLPQRSHLHLDALGRPRFRQIELGADYGGATVVSDLVEYDGLGRMTYRAEPFEWPVLPFAPEDLPAERKEWPFGFTFVHDAIGRVERSVEAPGQRPGETVTDTDAHVFVRDAQYTWTEGQAVVSTRGAAENDLGVPSSGARNETRLTGLGWPVEEARYAAGGTRIDLVRRDFDRLGREVALHRYRKPDDATGAVTWTRRRDTRGLVLELTEPGSSPRLTSYDEWGAALESEWLDGGNRRRTRHGYDGLGRVTTVRVFSTPQGGGVDTVETYDRYHYDAHSGSPLQPASALRGRLSRIEAVDVGDVYYAYDALGRSTGEVTLLTAHGIPMGTSWSYQPGGALRELHFDTSAGTDTIGYMLDSAARVRAIVDTGTGTELFASTHLDAEGRYRSFRLGNGVVEKFKYATVGREYLGSWTIQTASGVQTHDFLARDAESRVLGERYNQQGFTFDVTHEFDDLDRLVRSAALTSTPLASQDERFSYDHLGNFKTQRNLFNSLLDRDYKVDPADPDRLCRFDPAGQTGSGCTFSYDGAGNLKTDSWAGTRTFSYDSASRVSRIVKGTWRADFLYGPGGSLVRTEVRKSQSLDRRIWRFGDLIEERRRPDGRIQIERRIPGPLGIVATLRTEGGNRETVYVHGEGRGNRFFTKADGTLSQQVRYRAFGGIVANTGQAASLTYSDDLWNGGDDLAELGVTNLGARLYDPVLGRFLQRDPISLRNPATRGNPYTFSYNDPVNYSDPTGLCVEDACIDVAFDSLVPSPMALGDLAKRFYRVLTRDVRTRTRMPRLTPPHDVPDYNILNGQPFQFHKYTTGEIDWDAVATSAAIKVAILAELPDESRRQALSMGACFITLPVCLAVNTAQAADEGEAGAAIVFSWGGPKLPNKPSAGGAAVGLAGGAVRYHKHHTIPREVLKMLPPDVAAQVRGKAGAPNRWLIPEDLHKRIHRGAGGGAYNDAFKQRLRDLGREPTAADVFEIRDSLVAEFGLEAYRPK